MDNNSALQDALEDVLLNKSDLNKLKFIIKQVALGKSSDKILREHIVKSRMKMVNELLGFFPFYAKLEEGTNNSLLIDELKKEVQEKNIFLDQIGKSVDSIYKKLIEKKELVPEIKENTQLIRNEESQESELKFNLEPLKNKILFINKRDLKIDEVKFIIDGANITIDTLPNGKKIGRISKLYKLIKKLNEVGIKNYKIMCDRSLYYNIDKQEEYQELIESQKISEISGGSQADNYILQYAIENDAYMITGDLFTKKENKEFVDIVGREWINERRIGFHFEDDVLYFDRILKIKD